MVGFFSSINHRKFLVVLIISFLIMMLFQLKNEEVEIIKIKDITAYKNGVLEGVINRDNNVIYVYHEDVASIINNIELSDDSMVQQYFPQIKKIGKIETINIANSDNEPSNWDARARMQWTRNNLKDISIAVFFLLLFVYVIAFLPGFIRDITDRLYNSSMMPFSYRMPEKQKELLSFECTSCHSKLFPKILKEEFVESMQFVYTECVVCHHTDKHRLK